MNAEAVRNIQRERFYIHIIKIQANIVIGQFSFASIKFLKTLVFFLEDLEEEFDMTFDRKTVNTSTEPFKIVLEDQKHLIACSFR